MVQVNKYDAYKPLTYQQPFKGQDVPVGTCQRLGVWTAVVPHSDEKGLSLVILWDIGFSVSLTDKIDTVEDLSTMAFSRSFVLIRCRRPKIKSRSTGSHISIDTAAQHSKTYDTGDRISSTRSAAVLFVIVRKTCRKKM